MATTRLFTVDDLLAMGEDAPYELVRGELRRVSPASMHPTVVTGRVFYHVFGFVDPRRLGYVTSAEGGFVLIDDPQTMIAPDVGFIRADRAPEDITAGGFFPVPPDLAIEVVSPSNRAAEIAEKVELYLSAGVPLIWVFYPLRRSVVIHRRGHPPRTVGGDDVLDGGEILPGFRLRLADIFREPAKKFR